MSTVTITPTRTPPSALRLFAANVRAEWTKLRTVRSTVWTLLATLFILLTHPAPAAPAGAPPPLLPEPVVSALAQELSGQNARHVVQELSLHHRMRGSEGYRAAAEAIRDRAVAYGLSEVEILELPADGEVFYGTQRSRPAWDARFAELWEMAEVEGAWRDEVLVASWAARPVTLAQDSASGEAEAELVDVGAGTSAADYESKEVAGKLVLVSSQPGAAYPLAVTERGAAGIVSYAQNQKSAWWGEDGNLVRWGHLATFPEPTTFAFMVTVNQAEDWKARLAGGERVRLSARVVAGQHPGAYHVVTAAIPGTDPELADEEIVEEGTSAEEAQKFVEHHVKAEECHPFFRALRAAMSSTSRDSSSGLRPSGTITRSLPPVM